MKTYEAIVLVLAPLGTGLAAFDYASGWDRPVAVARASAAKVAPCPDPRQERKTAGGTCLPAIRAEAAGRRELAVR